MSDTIHALVWWSRIGSDQGLPWWVLELDTDKAEEPPKRCAEVKWFGGTARTVYRKEGFTDLPDGPRGIIELHVSELVMIREVTPTDDNPPPHTVFFTGKPA